MSSTDTETLAEGFAAQAREELVARFREAYANALGTHSDLVSFDGERIEAMVQRSAADADGLQWRRALAAVAAPTLGIELGAALTHPAVVRAHQLAGAPSYESALAALAVHPAAPVEAAPDTAQPEPDTAEPEELTEAEVELIEDAAEAELAVVMPSASVESEPEEPALVDAPTMAYAAVDLPEPARADEPPSADEFTFEQDAVELPMLEDGIAEFGAVHLGGVASLPSPEEIALRLSEDGLDLLQDDGTIVGRLGWPDIAALEVTVPHGRRRRHSAPRLVVHTAGGSARFEVPGLSGAELQDQVEPLMTRFGR